MDEAAVRAALVGAVGSDGAPLLAPDEAPPWDEVRAAFERLFARHAESRGLVIRHRRFLWRAVVD